MTSSSPNAESPTQAPPSSIGPPPRPGSTATSQPAPDGPASRRKYLGYQAGKARLRRRFGALIIDNLVLAPALIPCAVLMGGYGPRAGVVYLGAAMTYFFVLEARSGQTLGKRAAGLRVVRVDGQPVDEVAIGARTVLRLLDGLPGPPLLGALSMTLTESRRRRIGDLAGGTMVVDAEDHPFVRASRSTLAVTYPVLWLAMAVLAALAMPVPADPGPAAAGPVVNGSSDASVSRGTVWVTSTGGGSVSRFDARTGAQLGEPIPIRGAPVDIVAVGDEAWFADHAQGRVGQIMVGARGPKVAMVTAGAGPFGIAYGYGSVWVTNEHDGTVTRIDPRGHRRVGKPIRVGNAPHGVVAAAGAVWVANSGGTAVTRIDPRSLRTTRIPVGGPCHDIAAGARSVWVVCPEGGLVRIDPRTGAVVGSPIAVGAGPTSAEMQGRAVWIANSDDGTVVRVDSRSGKLVGRPIYVGAEISDVAVSGSAVWVALAGDNRPVRVR